MEREATFRIVLEGPPPGVDFGLQKGRGAAYETIQTQRSTGKDLQFEFRLAIASQAETPDLRGPLVQGPRGQRFVYLDIGTFAGQRDTPWSRRLKIPLTGITRKMLDAALSDARKVLEARVPGTGKDGGPSCATVKPLEGWKLA